MSPDAGILELRVKDFGVIAELGLLFKPGMTAITGETGTGKTLVVEAIELLVGGRADPVHVRPGAEEARVEGRFFSGRQGGGEELVMARVIPRSGRSRAYLNGRLATVSELAHAGRDLVDLHGQHAHQSLLSAPVQRAALDRFGRVDLSGLEQATQRLREIDSAIQELGGDSRARAREIDLLRYQIHELAEAAIEGPDEDARLEVEEDALAGADSHRQAGAAAYQSLMGDGGMSDALGRAQAACAGRRPFSAVERALDAISAELADTAADLRAEVDAIADDPERLEAVRQRRRYLRDLCRKYGEQLSDVIAFDVDARARLAELEAHDDLLVALESERDDARSAVQRAAAAVGAARRAAAPRLAAAVEAHLQSLAMPAARFEVSVGDEDPGHEVSFRLGANPGEPALEMAKVASGGELARTMLAARLVLTDAPPTLVFDEVDAGVGGEAALAVGRSLASLAAGHQVIVVTHLPQVAAFADHQVAVTKTEEAGRNRVDAKPLGGQDRVVELSRMLSGQPTSTTAQGHAQELLATATRERNR